MASYIYKFIDILVLQVISREDDIMAKASSQQRKVFMKASGLRTAGKEKAPGKQLTGWSSREIGIVTWYAPFFIFICCSIYC